jgi:YVTN family beta-propeller protein
MDLHQTVDHGKHRRKSSRRRIAVMSLSLAALLAGASVAAFLWTRGPTSSDGLERAAPASGATHSGHTHVAPTTGPAAPAASVGNPEVGPPVVTGITPHHMAVAPDGRFAYIADPAAGAVIRFDTASASATATIPIPEAPPQLVTFAPDGSRAYVSAYTDDFSVDVVATVDTRTDTEISAIPVGRGPYAVSTTPDGRLLYVPYYDQDFLDVLDTSSGTMVDRIPAAPCPHWVAFTRDGRFAYTTNHFSDVVTVLELPGNTVVTTIPVGHGPHSLEMSPDGTRIAVVNYISGDVSVIDTAGNTVVSTVPAVGAGPQDVTYAPDGRHFYTANVDDGTVSVVDALSGAVTARIATGDSPTSVAVTPDGRRAFVTNFGDGTVRLLETASDQAGVGPGPGG